ncbi:serine/threonine-protein kinase N2-like [Protopterus annectens]|uniref:serine/threonine-protein kinase N2-like n=1 Tax=Protopterus annectens TaxID=7888 RepID=UPI001CFA55A5|nr:serine/threonine-protein kinase N2-like [Protopterus annectens]
MENTTEKLDLTMENMENTIEKLLSYCEKLMKETKETTSFHVDRKHSSDKMEHILQGLEHSDLLNEKTSTDSKWDSETKWEHKSLESSSTSAYSLKTNNDSDYDYSTSAMTPRTDSGEKGNPSDDTKQTLYHFLYNLLDFFDFPHAENNIASKQNPEIKQEHESPEPCVTLLHTLERIINSTLANKCSPVSAQPSPSLKKKHFLDEIQQIQVMDASGLQMDIVYEQNPETECKCESPEPCMSSALSPRSDTQSISQDIQLKHEDLRFVKNLAKGKFQQIFLAEFKGTSQRFAIKASEKHKKDQSKLDKLVLEKQIWEDTSSVKHPFLINLFTCFETQDHIYFVMEYAANGNLWQQLQSGPFSEHKAM